MSMSSSSGPSRRIRRLRAASTLAAAAALALAAVPAGTLGSGSIGMTLQSDTSWWVGDADEAVGPDLSATLPAAAQKVCLNDTHPSNCDLDATRYGYAGGGWGANDQTPFDEGFQNARWIWAPGIDGKTTPADGDTYYFGKEVVLPWKPTSATIWIAVDDSATVRVNGEIAGSATGNAALTAIDLTALLDEGANEIVVQATNGVVCNEVCEYERNPGGVLFGIGINYVYDSSFAPTVPPTSTIGQPAAPSGPSLLPIAILAAGAVMAAVVAVPSRRRR